MKEASFLIRWGIPGSIFFIMFFIFVQIDNIWCNLYYYDTYFKEVITIANGFNETKDRIDINKNINKESGDIQQETDFLNMHSLIHRMHMDRFFKDYSLVGLVAFFVSSSIPIGFIISQLYYFGFWSGFPFRSRRNIRKILNLDEINVLLNNYKIKKLIDEEIKYDSKRLREKAPSLILSFLYYFNYIMYHLSIYPLILVYRTIENIFTFNFNNFVNILKSDYKKSNSLLIVTTHYEWVALDWHCKLHATREETTRLESLGNVFHSLGTTYIAVILSWLIFTLLHLFLHNYDKHHNIYETDSMDMFKITISLLILLFFVLWQNRKAIIRHQNLFYRTLFDRIARPKNSDESSCIDGDDDSIIPHGFLH